MKKVLLYLGLSLLLLPAYGQLTNASFETWTTTSYDEPTGWQTGNHESASIGLIPVTKVNGTSGFAVRMETIASNGDTAHAYIANGDPMSGQGGLPFIEQPTAIHGFYRYNLPGNDTALLLVQFKKNGSIFSSNIFKIRGTGTQNSFTSFSFPISLAMAPDTLILAATSSNLIDNVGVEDGSFLELDAVAFTGASTPVDNGNFENWTTQSNNVISNWETYGDGVARTSDSYDGQFAMSLTTVDYGGGNVGSAGITNGHNTQTGPTGGIPYTLTADTLTGYYKFSTSGNDSASVNVNLLLNSNYVSGNSTLLPAAAQYTYFEIPIYSGTVPDTLRLDITSSKWPYSPSSIGSTLIIDNIHLKSELFAGVKNPFARNSVAYPNPVHDVLHIKLIDNSAGQMSIEVFDIEGKLVMTNKTNVTDGDMLINVSTLSAGKYTYRITGKNVSAMKDFIKQ